MKLREIKFRGKQKTWVTGGFVRYSDGRCVILNDYEDIEVTPESVGQFTGLVDKNGVDIFEGDICKRDRHLGFYEVVFRNGSWAVKNETEKAIWHQEFCNGARSSEYEVIGNIIDNPELLK